MAPYSVVITKDAAKDIKKTDKPIALRIQKKINYFLSANDPVQYAEKLTKPADAQYRWRVGDYRILFDVNGSTVTILKVQHRRQVYNR